MADAMRKLESSVSVRPMKKERFIEKMEPRNTNYNETVRANNRRMDRGQPTKAFPRGKVASQTWRGKKARSSGR